MNAVLHGGAPWHRAEESRAFNYAVAGSLLLHALLLFVFPALRQPTARPETAPAPIVARLVQPPSAPLAAQKPQEEPTPIPSPKEKAPQPVAKRASPPKTNARAKAEPKAAPTPAQLTALQVAPAPSSAEDASNTAAPSSAPPPAPVAKAEPLAVPSAPRPQTADPGSLAQYRLQLIAVARRYKRYPRVAMENNWEGAAEVTMLIGLNGAISSATIKTSSGYDVLDQQALEMFKRAQPIVPIPPALRGKQFAVVLRAIYNLKEEPDS